MIYSLKLKIVEHDFPYYILFASKMRELSQLTSKILVTMIDVV